MTTTAPVASPVDFAAYGDYAIKAATRPDGSFERPLYASATA